MATIEENWEAHAKAMTALGVLSEVEVTYIVSDVEDEEAALRAVLAFVPKYQDFLYLSSVEIDERRAENIFAVNAIYSDDYTDEDTAEEEEATVRYASGGGTKRVLNAVSQRVLYGTDPGAGTRICWNGKTGDDCEVRGVDVPSAAPRKSYMIYKKRSNLTTAYESKMESLTGCVNSTTFKGYAEGECMFLGMSYDGEDTSSSILPVTFDFMIQRNEDATTIEGYPIEKVEGFEFPWVLRDDNDVVICIYAAQVNSKKDLNQLGI